MSNDIITNDFATKIRDRVKETVLGAIPDDKIDGLMQEAIKGYFETRRPLDAYGTVQRDKPSLPSHFEILVKEELEKRIAEKVQKEVKERLSNLAYNQKDMDEVMTRLAPAMMTSFLDSWMRQAFQQMANNTPYPQRY